MARNLSTARNAQVEQASRREQQPARAVGYQQRQFLTLLGAFLAANFSSIIVNVAIKGEWASSVVDLLCIAVVVQAWRKAGEQTLSDIHLAVCSTIASASPLSHALLAAESHQVTILAVVLVSLPFFLGTSRLFMPVLSIVFVGWILVASSALPTTSAIWGTGVLALSGVAAMWHRLRVRKLEQTKLREAAAELERLKAGERKRIAVEASNNGYWYWDVVKNRIQFSDSWAEMLGYHGEELTTDPEFWFGRVHPHHAPRLKEALTTHLYGKTARFQAQYKIRHRDGHYIWVLNRGRASRNSNGQPVAMAGSQIDITHLIDSERSSLEDSFRDKLTSLANREALVVRLERALEHARRGEGGAFAVLFLDLDQFKVVNDSLGHLVGDQLLAAAAARLLGCVRESRSDLVSRFGGDEFVILLEEISSAGEAITVAQRIEKSLSEPFTIGNQEIRTGASIGIALGSGQVDSAEDILRNADTAMYRAKAAGRGQVVLFSADMHDQAVRMNKLRTSLIGAIDRGELFLEYQPIVSATNGQILGAEALVRWRHDGEMISPGEFIPIAEETGLIVPMGKWILNTACMQAAAWARMGLADVKISVNVSPRQLREKSLARTVGRILEESHLDPSQLELEITETALMSHVDVVAETIAKLDSIGVGFALDDFGTGYSSIEHLRKFTFRSLKIDRSFVAGLPADSKSAAVAGGLIDLAHQLGLTVTAEGVETPKQFNFLKSLDCDKLQGYLFSRPIASDAFVNLLRSGQPLVRVPEESALSIR
jgi:diguanylate cyclase (GGDEF)-like protein/PAS domain S-box-containing protein